MNTAQSIKMGHGNLLFKLLMAGEKCHSRHLLKVSWNNPKHTSVAYAFNDRSVLIFNPDVKGDIQMTTTTAKRT